MQSIRTHYNCVKKTRYTKLVIVLIACFVFSLSFFSLQTPSTSAAPSAYINYQGKLLDSSGYAVADGVYYMEFKIYDQSAGGNTLWTETWPIAGANVATVDDGLFTIKLGTVTAFPATMDFQAENGYWLGVNIGGTAGPNWDGEMTPRKEITSVAYALNANRLDGKSEEEFADLDENETITGQYTHDVTSPTGDALNLQFTATSNLASDDLAVLQITATQDATDGDNLYGIYINDLQGTAGAFEEYAIYQKGTGWDYGLYVEDDARFNANIELENGAIFENSILDQVTLSAHFLPATDDSYDLGSSDARWRDLYLGPNTLHIGTNTGDEGTISYNTADNDLLINSVSDVILQSSGGNVGIGIINPTSELYVSGDAYVSLRFDTATHDNNVGLNLPINDGAPGNVDGRQEGDIVWDLTNDELYVYDGAAYSQIGGGGGLWTDGVFNAAYLTDLTADFALGAADTLVAPFSVDVSTNNVRIGAGTGTGNSRITMYANDNDTGYLEYTTSDRWEFVGGNMYFNDTSQHFDGYNAYSSIAPFRGYNSNVSGEGGQFYQTGTGAGVGSGVYGSAVANSSSGVYGTSSGTTGYGGYFLASNTDTGSSLNNYGVYAETRKPAGIAGKFVANTTTSNVHRSYGVYSEVYAKLGTAGYFHSTDTDTSSYFDYAVYAETEGPYSYAGYFKSDYTGVLSSVGIYAQTNGTGWSTRAGYFVAAGASGANYGVYSRNYSTSGRAGHFYASASSGTTYGVWGLVTSSAGWPGYFEGGQGVYIQNYLYVGDNTPAGSYNIFGTSGTDHGLSGNSDVLISGNLEVNDLAYFDGAINVSNTADTTAGNIRWSGADFEGYDGIQWVSFTSGGAGGGLWTDAGAYTYLTASLDDLLVGSDSDASRPFYFDVGEQELRIGSGDSQNANLVMYDSSGASGDLIYSNDTWKFTSGSVELDVLYADNGDITKKGLDVDVVNTGDGAPVGGPRIIYGSSATVTNTGLDTYIAAGGFTAKHTAASGDVYGIYSEAHNGATGENTDFNYDSYGIYSSNANFSPNTQNAYGMLTELNNINTAGYGTGDAENMWGSKVRLINHGGNPTGNIYGLEIESDTMVIDDMLRFVTSNNASADYGINMSSAVITAGDILLQNSAIIENLTSGIVTLNADFSPSVHDTYNLGSSDARWADAYLGPGSLFIGDDDNDYRINYITGNSTLVFNEDGYNRDIRVEGNNDMDLLFIDAGLDAIGVNTQSPNAKLEVIDTSGEQLRLSYTDSVHYAGFTVDNNGDLTIDATGGDIILAGGDNLRVSASSDILINGIEIGASTAPGSSGARYIGVAPDNLTYSSHKNVQQVLEDLDQAIDDASADSLWTDAGKFTYLTATADDLVVGSNATDDAEFWMDVSDKRLHLGDGYIDFDNTSTAVGDDALRVNAGMYNISLGYQTLYTNTNGVSNVAVGHQALYSNDTTRRNTAIGDQALYFNTADDNTAVGFHALYNNISGTDNTALGYSALHTNTNGVSNVAVGHQALFDNTANNITAVGYRSLYNNSSGQSNVALGYQTSYTNSTGANTTAIGYEALFYNTANNITAVGFRSLYNNSSGTGNTALGFSSLYTNSTGINNTALGYESLYKNATGDDNIAIGYQAVDSNSSGSGNIGIGSGALQSNVISNYSTAVGYRSLYNNTAAANTGFGGFSLFSNTTGGNNVGLGYFSLGNNQTGDYNVGVGDYTLSQNTVGNLTAVGYKALANNTIGTYNIAFGYKALVTNTNGTRNTALGYMALASNDVNTDFNTAVGATSLWRNTTGQYNVAMGNSALSNNATGDANIAIGSNALLNNKADNNTAVGFRAMQSNISGTENVSLGHRSLYTNTTGGFNTAIGYEALYDNTASDITAVGYRSLYNNSSGLGNVALGYQSLYTNTTDGFNTAIGYEALYDNVASGITGVGYRSLYNNSSGIGNTALGYSSLFTNTIGVSNTALGSNAGENMTGSNNVALGYYAGRYETGGNTLYIDSIDRTNLAGGRTKSLVYGEFASSTADQLFRINAFTQIQGDLVVGSLATTDAEFWVEISGGDSEIHSIGNLKVSADNWQVNSDGRAIFNDDILSGGNEIIFTNAGGMGWASPDLYLSNPVSNGDIIIDSTTGAGNTGNIIIEADNWNVDSNGRGIFNDDVYSYGDEISFGQAAGMGWASPDLYLSNGISNGDIYITPQAGRFTFIGSDLMPEIDDMYDLGSPDVRWQDGHFSNRVYVGDTLILHDDYILDTNGRINLKPNNDTDDYVYISSDSTNLAIGTTHSSNLWIKPDGNRLYFQNGGDFSQGIQFLDADGGTPILNIDTTNERVGIGTAAPDYALDVAGSVGIDDYIYHNGDADTYMRFINDDDLDFVVNGIWAIAIDGDTLSPFVRGNPQNASNMDFAWDGDITDSIFFIDASSEYIGIGVNNPGAKLDVRNLGTEDILNLYDGATEVFTVLDGGNVGIGTATPGYQLEVASLDSSAVVSLMRTDGTIVDTEELGKILFRGSDSDETGAMIVAKAVNSWGDEADNDAPTKLSFYTQTNGNGNGLAAETMTIYQASGVGVMLRGNNPSASLHVESDKNHQGFRINKNLTTGTGNDNQYWQLSVKTLSNTADLVFNDSGTDRIVFQDGGNVGIGVNDPNNLIQVNGLINFDDTNDITALGQNALNSNNADGLNNTAVGYRALYYNLDEDYNTALGHSALYYNDYLTSNAHSNTGVGDHALYYNRGGDFNVAVGKDALYGAAGAGGGNRNVGVGYNALRDIIDGGNYNVGVGSNALANITNGDNNVGIGRYSLYSVTTTSHNTAIGYYSNAAGTGTRNTAIGYYSGYNADGDNNTIVGEYAGYNLSGDDNVAIGAHAGRYYGSSNRLYINNQDRTNASGDEQKSIIYGRFAATAAAQDLRFNADVGINVNPLDPLHVLSASDHKAIRIEENSGGEYWQMGVQVDGDLRFYDSGSANATVVFEDSVNGGDVGIGQTEPFYKLDVYDSITTFAVRIQNDGNQVTNHGLLIQAGEDNDFDTGTKWIQFADGDGNRVGKIYGAGGPLAGVTYGGTGSDLAEYFWTNDTDLVSGEVVCIDSSVNNSVKRCINAVDSNVFGIISTSPSFVGNLPSDDSNPNYKLVSMVGQVPTKVNDENGAISRGDYLTSSSTAGEAMKADSGDPTVGVAVEPLGAGSGTIQVVISRNNGSNTTSSQWSSGANGLYQNDMATIIGPDIAFNYVTGAAAGDLKVADDFEIGDDGFIGGDLVIGAALSSTETLDNVGFVQNGNDLFVAGDAGIEGNIYTDGSFIAGSGTTTYSDGSITSTGAMDISSSGDLTLDSGSGTLKLGAGTNEISNTDASTDLTLNSNGNINFFNNTNYIDSSGNVSFSGSATFAGGINTTGSFTAGSTVYGDGLISDTGALNISSGIGQDLILDSDSGTLVLGEGTNQILASQDLTLSSGASSDLILDSASGTLKLGAGTNEISNTDAGADLTINSNGDINFFNSNNSIDSSGNLTIAGSLQAALDIIAQQNLIIKNQLKVDEIAVDDQAVITVVDEMVFEQGITISTKTDVIGTAAQVNTNGFGNSNNQTSNSAAVYNGKLYIGTENTTDGAELWAYDGSAWASADTAGFGDASNDAINSMIAHSGRLFMGTNNANEAEVWICDENNNCIQENLGASFDGNNDSVSAITVHNGKLYIGTENPNDDSEVWQYIASGDWVMADDVNGFIPPANNSKISALLSSNSQLDNAGLLAGTERTGGAQLWRHEGNDTWTRIDNGASDSFGDTNNTEVMAMTAYNGQVFIGTKNSNGCIVYKQNDDYNNWDAAGSAGLLSSAYTECRSLVVYNGDLYSLLGKTSGSGMAVAKYDADENTWSSVYTNASDYAGHWLQVYGRKLYFPVESSNQAQVFEYEENTNLSEAIEFEANGETAALYFKSDAAGDANIGQQSAGAFIMTHTLITNSGSYDIAEDWPTEDPGIEAGDVVAIDPFNKVHIIKGSNITSSVGIISTEPGYILSQEDDGRIYRPVALAGRVPVKITDENGPVKAGDLLTPSSIPGYAMKLIGSGSVIGKALEDYDFITEGDSDEVMKELTAAAEEFDEIKEDNLKLAEETEEVLEAIDENKEDLVNIESNENLTMDERQDILDAKEEALSEELEAIAEILDIENEVDTNINDISDISQVQSEIEEKVNELEEQAAIIDSAKNQLIKPLDKQEGRGRIMALVMNSFYVDVEEGDSLAQIVEDENLEQGIGEDIVDPHGEPADFAEILSVSEDNFLVVAAGVKIYGDLYVEGNLVVAGDVKVDGDLKVGDKLYISNEMSGAAVIASADQILVEVKFNNPFEEMPRITVTPELAGLEENDNIFDIWDGRYVITGKDKDGFVINIAEPLCIGEEFDEDIEQKDRACKYNLNFDWIAFGVVADQDEDADMNDGEDEEQTEEENSNLYIPPDNINRASVDVTIMNGANLEIDSIVNSLQGLGYNVKVGRDTFGYFMETEMVIVNNDTDADAMEEIYTLIGGKLLSLEQVDNSEAVPYLNNSDIVLVLGEDQKQQFFEIDLSGFINNDIPALVEPIPDEPEVIEETPSQPEEPVVEDENGNTEEPEQIIEDTVSPTENNEPADPEIPADPIEEQDLPEEIISETSADTPASE